METQNWLLKQASTQPDKVAVTDGTSTLTFRQVKDQVEQIAGKLNQLHSGPRVGMLADNSIESYKIALAILCSGRTIVWLNWRLADEELQRQISDSSLAVCLVADSLWQSTMDERFVSYQGLSNSTARRTALIPSFDYDRVASIMYTSGTTGAPKGVLQTFGNHFYSAVSSALNLDLTSDEEWLCVAPIFHISGFSIIMRGLIYGMTVRIVDKFRALKVENILVNEPVTIMSVVPFMLKKLLARLTESHRHYNHAFRCMLLGGGDG